MVSTSVVSGMFRARIMMVFRGSAYPLYLTKVSALFSVVSLSKYLNCVLKQYMFDPVQMHLRHFKFKTV